MHPVIGGDGARDFDAAVRVPSSPLTQACVNAVRESRLLTIAMRLRKKSAHTESTWCVAGGRC
jgi:hypothetical protein